MIFLHHHLLNCLKVNLSYIFYILYSDALCIQNTKKKKICYKLVLKISPTPSEVDLSLINATYMGKIDRVKQAINNGANVNRTFDEQTILMMAIERRNIELIKFLLTVPNININIQNESGFTALIIAVQYLAINVNNHTIFPLSLSHHLYNNIIFFL